MGSPSTPSLPSMFPSCMRDWPGGLSLAVPPRVTLSELPYLAGSAGLWAGRRSAGVGVPEEDARGWLGGGRAPKAEGWGSGVGSEQCKNGSRDGKWDSRCGKTFLGDPQDVILGPGEDLHWIASLPARPRLFL